MSCTTELVIMGTRFGSEFPTSDLQARNKKKNPLEMEEPRRKWKKPARNEKETPPDKWCLTWEKVAGIIYAGRFGRKSADYARCRRLRRFSGRRRRRMSRRRGGGLRSSHNWWVLGVQCQPVNLHFGRIDCALQGLATANNWRVAVYARQRGKVNIKLAIDVYK